jgi:intracellular septation protein A
VTQLRYAGSTKARVPALQEAYMSEWTEFVVFGLIGYAVLATLLAISLGYLLRNSAKGDEK